MSIFRILSLTVVALLLGGRALLAEDKHGSLRRGSAAYAQAREAPAREGSPNLQRLLPSPHGHGLSASTRDDDHDGIPNRRDPDDDNDGVRDDLE